MRGGEYDPHRDGVSLAEVVVASGLLAMLAGSVLPVTASIAHADEQARLRARAHAAAASHLDRLRALPWYALPGGGVALDEASLVRDAGYAAGGTGLGVSVGALDVPRDETMDVPGPEDAPVVPRVALARRWEVRAHGVDPRCRVVEVEVARQLDLDAGVPMARAALARVASLVCVTGARP